MLLIDVVSMMLANYDLDNTALLPDQVVINLPGGRIKRRMRAKCAIISVANELPFRILISQ